MKDSVPIECRDATVQFSGGVRAVDSVNLVIRGGERLAIVGQSGCGKTTLLRAIAGLQDLTSGAIEVGKTSDTGDTSMSFVFQQPALLPWRRVIDNVSLPLELQRKSERRISKRERLTKGEREAAAASTLDEVELGHAHSQFPHELSGGMRMRVSIARALVTQPRLLLLDEPFAALDDLLRTQLGDLVRQVWRSHGFTMLLVTHNIGEAIEMSDRICVMSRGKIVAVLDNPMRTHTDWQGGSMELSGIASDTQTNAPQTKPLQTKALQTGREMRRSSEFGQFYGEVSDRLCEAAEQSVSVSSAGETS